MRRPYIRPCVPRGVAHHRQGVIDDNEAVYMIRRRGFPPSFSCWVRWTDPAAVALVFGALSLGEYLDRLVGMPF